MRVENEEDERERTSPRTNFQLFEMHGSVGAVCGRLHGRQTDFCTVEGALETAACGSGWDAGGTDKLKLKLGEGSGWIT